MGSTVRFNRTIRAGVVAAAFVTAVAATSSVTIATSRTPAGAVTQVTSGRVDLAAPVFSDPTNITNPLFPVGNIEQVIQLGAEGDVALRHEITRLARTKTIAWNGERIEAVASHFVAYGDGELLEVAIDYFAQADDGSVWYLGENVDNYENGVIADHDGTWLAGRDGPAGMIMPAHPRVGDVYRPENIPGVVFEEVTVRETNVSLAGPSDPVTGAIRVQERLLDGTLEDKTLAPGHGEFIASVPSSDEYVEVAVAVPTDERDGRKPQELTRLAGAAQTVFAAAPSADWRGLATTVAEMKARWASLRQQSFPPLLIAETTNAFETLTSAITARDVGATRQAAIMVSQATADLALVFVGVDRVDRDRVSLWRDQLKVDRASGDAARVAGDRSIIRAIRMRTNA